MSRLGRRQLSHELDNSRKIGPSYILNKTGRYLNKTSRVGDQPAAQPAANIGAPPPRGRSTESRQPSRREEVELGDAAGRERRPSSCRSTHRSRVVSGGIPEARASSGAWMGAPDRVLTRLQRQPGMTRPWLSSCRGRQARGSRWRADVCPVQRDGHPARHRCSGAEERTRAARLPSGASGASHAEGWWAWTGPSTRASRDASRN